MDELDCLILQHLNNEWNLTKAAERLHMTQPALTYRLKQIEKEFQAELFTKNGKRIDVTPAGELIMNYAKKRLVDLRITKEQVLSLNHEVTGNLKLGVSSQFGLLQLPSILEHYVADFPSVCLNVNTGYSTEMMDLLLKGEIDIAIVKGDYNWSDKKELLWEEHMCVIAKSAFSLNDLQKMPMISRKEPNVLLQYRNQPNITIEQNLDYWWNERFQEPPISTMQVDSYETCKEMVKRGFGFSIIPQAFIKNSDGLHTENIVFKNGNKLNRRTWLLYREASSKLSAVAEFVSLIRNTVDAISTKN